MTYHFRDPIHGMIPINAQEVAIIQTPAFQRLRQIHQLGTTYLVYHGAEHTRFGHSIGVMHLVMRAIDALSNKEPLRFYKEQNPTEFDKWKQTARLAALLHDIGHAPFSHVGENKKFGLFPELEDVDGTIKLGHEVYSRRIIRDILGNVIEKQFPGIKTADILGLLLGTPNNEQFRFICDLLDGQLDVDKMDYLLRDSYYCGVKYGAYDLDRIMDVICICPTEYDQWQLGVDSNGVHAVEEFILARYWMFLQVYFHKTRRIYDYYLSHFLKTEFKVYPKELEDYLIYTDVMVLNAIRREASKNNWAKALFCRKHMKEVYVSKPHQESDQDIDIIGRLIDDFEIDFDSQIKEHRCYVDQADTSSAKSLIEIRTHIEIDDERDPEEPKKHKLPAIPVKDKLDNEIRPIQDYSLPIKHLSDRKINLFRIYSDAGIFEEVKNYINRKREEIPLELDKEAETEAKLQVLLKIKEETDEKKKDRLKRYKR